MIHEVLMEGAQNARTGKEICKLLGISSRELMAQVERERREGKPICANTSVTPGYFLAENRAEMERYCRSVKHRANELRKTLRACQQTIDVLPE